MSNQAHQEALLASRIGKKPSDVPVVVMRLLQATTQQSINENPLIKLDELGVSAKEIEDWFIAFAKGVQYVQDKHGCVFDNYFFGGSINDHTGKVTASAVLYDADNDTMALTRGFVADEIKLTRGRGAVFGHSNTDDKCIYTGLELATLLGVEEAYHAYQFKKLGHQYSADDRLALKDGLGAIQNSDAHYEENAIEKDARIVIRQAIQDFGFGDKGRV